jgi:hypothetical protein
MMDGNALLVMPPNAAALPVPAVVAAARVSYLAMHLEGKNCATPRPLRHVSVSIPSATSTRRRRKSCACAPPATAGRWKPSYGRF